MDASPKPSVNTTISTGALDGAGGGSRCSSPGRAVGEASACFGTAEPLAAPAAAVASRLAAEAKSPPPFSLGVVVRTAAGTAVELPSGGAAGALGTRLMGTALGGADDTTLGACDGSRVRAALGAGASDG